MPERKLPPDPEGMNDKRAEWAREAIETFSDCTGSEMLSEALGDLLSDMFHLCDREGLDMEAEIADARGCYYEEIDAGRSYCRYDDPATYGPNESVRTALMKEWASAKKDLEDSEEHRDAEGGFEDAEWASINDAAQDRARSIFRIAQAASVELKEVPEWLRNE